MTFRFPTLISIDVRRYTKVNYTMPAYTGTVDSTGFVVASRRRNLQASQPEDEDHVDDAADDSDLSGSGRQLLRSRGGGFGGSRSSSRSYSSRSSSRSSRVDIAPLPATSSTRILQPVQTASYDVACNIYQALVAAAAAAARPPAAAAAVTPVPTAVWRFS